MSEIFYFAFFNGYPMATHPEPLRCKGFRVFCFVILQKWLPNWLPSVIFPPFNSLYSNGLRNLMRKT